MCNGPDGMDGQVMRVQRQQQAYLDDALLITEPTVRASVVMVNSPMFWV